MARIWMTGAEGNDSTSNTTNIDWVQTPVTSGTGTVANQTTTVHGGSRAWRCRSGGSGSATAYVSSASVSGAAGETFWRAWLNFDNVTPAGDFVAMALTDNANLLISVRFKTSTNVLALYNETGTPAQIGTGSFSPAINTWYCIELGFIPGSGATCTAEFRVDLQTIQSSASLTISASAAQTVRAGIVTSSPAVDMSVYVDDMAMNDTAAGTGQTSWPGAGSVLLLVPASDNAVGTGWTDDAAATSNIFHAVDNKPPAGIADTTSGSGLHQIRNATANANVNYDANLTTYQAAGIGPADVINVVLPIAMTGAPVATQAKAGTLGVSSNPTIANVSLAAGGTSGAFWSGTAAGTYATGWKFSTGTMTHAPSVTITSAPVARITQVTSSTRIAMVTFLGLLVDYTPGTPPELRTTTGYGRPFLRQAVNRAGGFFRALLPRRLKLA